MILLLLFYQIFPFTASTLIICIALPQRVGVLGVLLRRGRQVEHLMAPLGTVVFFTVVAFVAAVCWYKWGLVGGSSSLEAHLAPAAGLSCSVSWQPISSPVEPQKRWEAACLGRLMEQTVPAGMFVLLLLTCTTSFSPFLSPLT